MRKRKAGVKTHRERLPFEEVARTIYIDPVGGDDTGDGSETRPIRTTRGLKKLIARLNTEHAKRESDAWEAKHKAEREASEQAANELFQKQEAERKKKAEEKVTREKELDEKITRSEVELMSLEKTFLEAAHSYEIAKLELMAGMRTELPSTIDRLNPAKELAEYLHHLRMLLIERKLEHDRFVDERNKLAGYDKWMHWLILGGMYVLGAAAYFIHTRPKAKK